MGGSNQKSLAVYVGRERAGGVIVVTSSRDKSVSYIGRDFEGRKIGEFSSQTDATREVFAVWLKADNARRTAQK